MSAMTRGQVERECQWLVMEHCQSAARKWDAHDALQRQRIAQLEETVSTLTRRDAEQQQREENWQHCFQEFKDLANGKERKYEQIHAVVLKDKIAQLEAEVARLNKVMDPIDQECCDLQEKWKAEAQWAAKQIVDHGALHPDSQQDIWHAQRILNGKL